MKIIERLKKYIEYKCISLNAFDKSIGSSNGYIGRQIKNEASIGGDIIEKISCIYTDLSLEWLIAGNGEMLKDNISLIKEVQENRQLSTHVTADATTMAFIAKITEQAEEIGRLKWQVEQLQQQKKPKSRHYDIAAEP